MKMQSPGEPMASQGLPPSSTKVLAMACLVRAPGSTIHPNLPVPVTSWASTVVPPHLTPSTTIPGTPPPFPVFIISTQFPSSSTMLSSQLSWTDVFVDGRPAYMAALPTVNLRKSVRSTFGLLPRQSPAISLW